MARRARSGASTSGFDNVAPIGTIGPSDGATGGSGEPSAADSDSGPATASGYTDPITAEQYAERDSGEPGGSEPRAKRKYTRRQSAEPKTPLAVGTIEKTLFGVHMMLANITGAMELKLDEFEAKQIAENLVEISKYYPLLQASEKAQAWCNLIIVIGVIYGSRIVAIRNRMIAEPGTSPLRNVTPTVIAQPATTQAAPPRAGNGSGPARPNNPPRPATEGFEWVFVPGANQWVEQPRGGFTHIIN